MTLVGSTLYGMTFYGGTLGEGTIFSIPVIGGAPTVLASFDGADGAFVYGSSTLAGSLLYGTANEGGANNVGVAFSLAVNELNNGNVTASKSNQAQTQIRARAAYSAATRIFTCVTWKKS